MKIAVFMAGQLRFLDKTYKTFQNLFPGHDVDFFVHCWKSNQYSEKDMIDMVNPKEWIYEEEKNFQIDYDKIQEKFPNKRDARYIYGVFSHYYSLSTIKNFNLDEYDYVLRIRSDEYFVKDLNYLFDLVGNKFLMNYSGVGFLKGGNNNDLKPWSINGQTTIIGDCCFFAKKDVFLRFTNGLFEFLTDYENNRTHEHSLSWTSECQGREYLWYRDIPYRHVKFPYLLFRNHHKYMEPTMNELSVNDPFIKQFVENNPIHEINTNVKNNPELFGLFL